MKSIIIILSSLLMITGCSSDNKKAGMGAGIGVAAGAVLGAVIGHQSGNRDKGALIGGALGGLAGGTIGHRLDKQAKELKQIAETKRTEHGIVTKLKGDILFNSGKAQLQPVASGRIIKIAGIIKKYPEDIVTIVGHTDSVGSDTTNQALSETRAMSVRTSMIQGGVPSSAIKIVGAGESQPMATNKTKDGRAMNRRVEIQISVDPAKVKKQ